MDDFKIIIDGKEHSCTKCDKVYVELGDSAARSDVDCTELKHLIESWNIPREPISCTMRIKKNTKNYKQLQELFEYMQELFETIKSEVNKP